MAIAKNKILPIITAITLLVAANPVFVWDLERNNYFKPLLMMLVGGIFIFKKKEFTIIDNKIFILFTITALLSILLTIIHSSSNNFGIISSMFVLFVVYIPFGEDTFIKDVYHYFITGYAIILTVSLVSWIFIIRGAMPSFGIIKSPFGPSSYINYPFVVVETNSVESFRFAGPFDEPGVIGTFSAIIICIQKFNFRDWRTIVIFIAGLLSLSMFFYGLIAIYGIIYLLFIKKNISYGIIFIAIFAWLFYITNDNSHLSKILWERFEWDNETQQFKGDDRINYAGNAYYQKLIGTSEYYWGVNDAFRYYNYAEGTCGYKNTIVSNGVIFFCLYLLFFILKAYFYRTNFPTLALYIFVLFSNTYQRPDIYGITIVFLYSYFARGKMSKLPPPEVVALRKQPSKRG